MFVYETVAMRYTLLEEIHNNDAVNFIHFDVIIFIPDGILNLFAFLCSFITFAGETAYFIKCTFASQT